MRTVTAYSVSPCSGLARVKYLAVVQTAMIAGLPYTALRDAILTHPTMAEGLNVLLTSVLPDGQSKMAARALARWEGEGGRIPTKNGEAGEIT